MKSVNENGTLYITASFYDTANALFTPAAADYRIDCLTTGNEVRAWTDLTPATSVTIAVTGDDTQIYNENNSREVRQLVVRYTDASGNSQTNQTQFRVDNLRGIT
jgi:hypothetical protein